MPGWPELSTAAAIGGDDLLDVRLTQIESGQEPPLDVVPRRAVAVTAVCLALLLAALAATVIGVDGPTEVMNMDGSGAMGGDSGALAAVGGLACGAAWLVGGLTLYRRFARRPG